MDITTRRAQKLRKLITTAKADYMGRSRHVADYKPAYKRATEAPLAYFRTYVHLTLTGA